MPLVHLTDRAVSRFTGPDAFRLLNDVVTVNMKTVAADGIGFGALLSPQGKVLFDFLIHRDDSVGPDRPGDREDPAAFLIDTRADAASALVKRLGFYKLRADVTISDPDDVLAVVASWDTESPPAGFRADPRIPDLAFRGIVTRDNIGDARPVADWHVRRIGSCVPEGGLDFAFGDIFPHDAAMDELHGIDFAKGCYVGQEVVSRMKHRGTVRRRVVCVTADTPLPPPGAPITSGGRAIGNLGTSARIDDRYRGIAIVRLDRLTPEAPGTIPADVDDVPAIVTMPDWAHYRAEGP